MVHRRLTADDKKGVGEPLNEPGLDWSGSGLIVRGVHRLMIDTAAEAPAALKRSAQDLLFRPLIAYASCADSPSQWVKEYRASGTGLKAPLPPNVQLLTAHAQGPKQVLVRLAHLFEANEDPALSQNVTVSLSDLFSGVSIVGAKETTLTANQPLAGVERHRARLSATGEAVAVPFPAREAEEEEGWGFGGAGAAAINVTLGPMQIRTFLCTTE
jgi:hypothetical protein